MAGIKNIQEIQKLGEVVMISIVEEIAKDGFQKKDLLAFMRSPEFYKAIGPAVDDIGEIGSELADLDMAEIGILARESFETLMRLVEAFKK